MPLGACQGRAGHRIEWSSSQPIAEEVVCRRSSALELRYQWNIAGIYSAHVATLM